MKILLHTSSQALNNEIKAKLKEHNLSHSAATDLTLDRVASNGFDVVFIDLNGNMKEFVSEILSINSQARIFVLSREPNFSEGREYLALGIKGYGNAHMQAVHFNDALDIMGRGDVWLYPEFIQSMIMMMTRENLTQKSSNALEKLTSKEKDVANLIYEGLTNQEIADSCGITLRTVKAHISAIFEKTGVKDRINLVLLMRKSS